VEIETGIRFTDAGIGHVLVAITDAPVWRDIPKQSDVGCELGADTEIDLTETITADVGRTRSAFDCERNPGATKLKSWTNGPDECVFTTSSKPTGRSGNA